MRNRAAVILACCAATQLSACAGGAPTPAAEPALELVTPRTLPPNQVAALQDGVRASLKDPTSAQFGQHKAGSNAKGGTIVCGWVNAKNSYGGYTGKQPYLALLLPDTGKFYVQKIGGTEAEAYAVQSVCTRSGLPLDTL